MLNLGSGRFRNVEPLDIVINRVAGGGTSTADGVPATEVALNNPTAIAFGPDGST